MVIVQGLVYEMVSLMAGMQEGCRKLLANCYARTRVEQVSTIPMLPRTLSRMLGAAILAEP